MILFFNFYVHMDSLIFGNILIIKVIALTKK